MRSVPLASDVAGLRDVTPRGGAEVKIVSEDACRAWTAERLRQPFGWGAMERAYPHSASYLLPKDAGRKTALARMFVSMIGFAEEGLLWITEWGVFPSSENMTLFTGYRRSLGENRSLRAAPGHLFEEADVIETECLLDLILYFFWSASVIDAAGNWLRISHDEVVTISTRDSAGLAEWRDALAAFDLEELSKPAF